MFKLAEVDVARCGGYGCGRRAHALHPLTFSFRASFSRDHRSRRCSRPKSPPPPAALR
jgi:hypothetical protein